MIIYVGNLPLETTEDELRRKFKEFGEVISVTIMSDRYIGSGQPRGYGYIEMASKSDGVTAISVLEGMKLGDRVVNVVEALPLSNRGHTVTADIGNSYRSSRKRER